MTDRDMRVLRVSPKWREDAGLGAAEVEGKSIYELLPALEARSRRANQLVLAGRPVSLERTRIAFPHGERWMRIEIVPWRDGRGHIGGLLVVSHDITDMVEAL